MNWMRRAFFCRLLTRAARPHCAKERSLASFLEAVGLGLGMVARRCFTRHGGEIDDVELVMHNEVLFVSAGEDFLPCRQSDAEALSFACQVMLEEELFHRRLVAQNQAAVASALPAPARRCSSRSTPASRRRQWPFPTPRCTTQPA